MTVIVDLTIPAQAFELGRILAADSDMSIELETIVPLGERPVPFFRVFDEPSIFEPTVADHPAVNEIHPVTNDDKGTVYTLDWDVSTDTFFEGLMATEATILGAQRLRSEWEFSLRFPSHETLDAFEAYCEEQDLPIELERRFNPTRPDAGPYYGLTPVQRKSLARAVEEGYYAIPREISTNGLAEAFGVSDQAMTERLRRGIMALVSSTLLLETGDGTN